MPKRTIIDVDQLCEDYLKDGATSKNLTKKYNCSSTTLLSKLWNSNNKQVLEKLEKNKDKEIKIKINELCDKYLQKGMTIELLSEIYNCSQGTIYRKLFTSKNEDVLNKLKNGRARTETNEININKNIIYVRCIYTGNVHIFDFDDKVYKQLLKHTWYESNFGYLQTTEKGIIFKAYWLVIGKPPQNMVVDHRNGNEKDNRKDNLRFANKSQNGMNRGANINNKTGYKGVSFHKQTGKYISRIVIDYKEIYIGSFPTPLGAYEARLKKEIELYGEFAYIPKEFQYILEEVNS